ncbi:conserved Plasmodium protein, unknown function [Plasmodium sp. gorilla clade G3]|nr:conserved Plasmodium protein, unknown function [Plasmodium sp. gorilla clade G3]
MEEQNISGIKEHLNFIVNEDEEFLNIFNYKQIKCYKTPNYIYIGQIKDNDDMVTLKNNDNIGNKDVIKKSQTKILGIQKDRVDKNKSKKTYSSIKNGYGVLISIKKNIDGEDIITNKFIGNWINDKKNGLGFNIDIYKNIYYGYYENNLKNGWGYYKWSRSGSTYEGNWLDNMMNGKGLYINKKCIYEGDFYNNLFINSKCEWIDILEIEMKNMNKNNIITNKSNDKVPNDIYLIILPFNFIKINFKKIASYIKYNYNKIPFLICTKKFIQQNKGFDITNFIFLSYYLDSSENLNEANMDSLIFDTIENEKGKKISKNYDDSILSEDTDNNSSLDVQKNVNKTYSDNKSKSKYSNEFKDFSISSHSSDSKGKNNSTSSTNTNNKFSDTNDSIYNSDCNDNYDSEHSNYSEISLPSITSKESRTSIFSQPDEIKRCNTYESQLNNISNHEDISYISSSNNKQTQPSIIGSNEEGNNNIEEYKENSYIHIEENEKKKKNEINNLINKYLNIYIDTDSSSSEYSLISSDMENIKNKNDLSKINIKNDKEEVKKNTTFENINTIPESNVLYDDIHIFRKKISRDISKIMININLLNKLRNSNISCIYRIRKKIKNSLKMKSPFIINFNIKKNKYQNVNEHKICLSTCTIPEWWNLDFYFGESENKICHDIFDPLYFQYNKGYKKIMNTSNIEKYDKEQEDIFSDIFNMKMFLSTDLLIDNTADIPQLKNIIKDKFAKFSYINNLFFIIIDQ